MSMEKRMSKNMNEEECVSENLNEELSTEHEDL